MRSYSPCRAGVAQLVEQGTENPRVGSSILSPGTTWKYRACVDQTQALFRIHHTKGRPFPTGMTADLRVAVAVARGRPSYRSAALPLWLYRKPRALSPPACPGRPIPLCGAAFGKAPNVAARLIQSKASGFL